MFTREAVYLIHERSRGIPRTISVICHNSLISAFALTRRPVTADIVREVCHDFDFEASDSPNSAGESPSTQVFRTVPVQPSDRLPVSAEGDRPLDPPRVVAPWRRFLSRVQS
jgi:hypothetical protein